MTTGNPISIPRIQREILVVDVKGTAPLIVHRWSEKAKAQMLAAQQGKKAPKVTRDPDADYEASMYRFPDDRHGFPVMAFKAATVKGGARAFGSSVKMTELRQSLLFYADGIGVDGTQLVHITGEPIMREDMVRIKGSSDLRYRAEYRDWTARLRVGFLPNVIEAESVVALIDAGGDNGVGEWRPEKSGFFGTYQVVGS